MSAVCCACMFVRVLLFSAFICVCDFVSVVIVIDNDIMPFIVASLLHFCCTTFFAAFSHFADYYICFLSHWHWKHIHIGFCARVRLYVCNVYMRVCVALSLHMAVGDESSPKQRPHVARKESTLEMNCLCCCCMGEQHIHNNINKPHGLVCEFAEREDIRIHRIFRLCACVSVSLSVHVRPSVFVCSTVEQFIWRTNTHSTHSFSLCRFIPIGLSLAISR